MPPREKVYRYRLQSLRTPKDTAGVYYLNNATLRDWDDGVDIVISFKTKHQVIDIGTLAVRVEIPEPTL